MGLRQILGRADIFIEDLRRVLTHIALHAEILNYFLLRLGFILNDRKNLLVFLKLRVELNLQPFGNCAP